MISQIHIFTTRALCIDVIAIQFYICTHRNNVLSKTRMHKSVSSNYSSILDICNWSITAYGDISRKNVWVFVQPIMTLWLQWPTVSMRERGENWERKIERERKSLYLMVGETSCTASRDALQHLIATVMTKAHSLKIDVVLLRWALICVNVQPPLPPIMSLSFTPRNRQKRSSSIMSPNRQRSMASNIVAL